MRVAGDLCSENGAELATNAAAAEDETPVVNGDGSGSADDDAQPSRDGIAAADADRREASKPNNSRCQSAPSGNSHRSYTRGGSIGSGRSALAPSVPARALNFSGCFFMACLHDAIVAAISRRDHRVILM